MKKSFYKTIFILSLSTVLFTSCVNEDEYDIPTVRDPFFKEDFQTVTNNTNLDVSGWTNYAESGTWLWREKTFTDNGVTNGYAEFSAYNSGSTLNKVWLISPAIDMSIYPKERLTFKIAQHHLDVDSPDNSLQVLISSDFDGTNVMSATWTPLEANIPTKNTPWYAFQLSTIDLSSYTGNIHVAFKFTGSGTNTTLDGAYQVDNFFIYNEK